MPVESGDAAEIGRCFDGCASRFAKRRGAKGLTRTARFIATYLAAQPLDGRRILEIGCGAGGLLVELMRRGAGAGHGVDLSPRLIELARLHAQDEGVDTHLTLEVGDGAGVNLPRSDVVILDTVLCCYPDARTLAKRTVEACESLYCFSVPRDRGLWRAVWHLAAPLYGLYVRIRGCRLHFFVHAIADIEAVLRERGFAPVLQQTTRMWYLGVFARQGAGSSD